MARLPSLPVFPLPHDLALLALASHHPQCIPASFSCASWSLSGSVCLEPLHQPYPRLLCTSPWHYGVLSTAYVPCVEIKGSSAGPTSSDPRFLLDGETTSNRTPKTTHEPLRASAASGSLGDCEQTDEPALTTVGLDRARPNGRATTHQGDVCAPKDHDQT